MSTVLTASEILNLNQRGRKVNKGAPDRREHMGVDEIARHLFQIYRAVLGPPPG